jgi:hypothetical protein
VCRAWRDALADPALWMRLDLSHAEWRRVLPVLHGAARRARGQVCQLVLSQQPLTQDELLPVLTANAGSLRELHLQNVYADRSMPSEDPTIKAVVAAAPLLQVLAAKHVVCTWEDAPRMLRAEPPFPTLHIGCSLMVNFDSEHIPIGGMERFGPFAAALSDAAQQSTLLRLCIQCADTAQPALMDALVDAALARRLRELALKLCTPPAAAPLARLLDEGSLTALEIGPSQGARTPLFDAAGADLVADALRMNTALTKLKLYRTFVGDDLHAAELLLSALVGHPSLCELRFAGEYTTGDDRSALGAALGALIAADAPALHTLDCSENSLADAGLAPIVEALALNRHLRKLEMAHNSMSEAFARERLQPALRANSMLREFKCVNHNSSSASSEVEHLVRRRVQQS